VVIAQLLHLEADSPDSPINIYLNSPGGSVTAMLGIYDTMQFVHAPVATTCIGQAASSAAVLLAAGAPGRRSVLPRSRVILHQPSGGGQGTLPDLAVQAKEIVRLRATMEEVLARHTGQSLERLREDTDRDLILDAEGAVAYGLADTVLASRKAA
jgi:ATP-dependent Clp protease protease subunit